MNAANAFTIARVVVVPFFAWLLFSHFRAAAAVVFTLAALTDLLDGWIARRLNQVTSIGASLDPTADKLLAGTAFVILALDARLPAWAVGVIIGREAAISGLRIALARRGRALPAVRIAKLKAWSQYTAIVALTLLPRKSPVSAAVLAVAVVLTVVSGYSYFAQARTGRAGAPWNR